MADVYGRLTGKPGVAMGQGAFLLTNSGMAILEAFLAGSPMLLLSDLSDGASFSQHGRPCSSVADVIREAVADGAILFLGNQLGKAMPAVGQRVPAVCPCEAE